MRTPNTDTAYNLIIGGVTTSLTYIIGDWNNLAISFSILMVLDYITGVMVGVKTKHLSSVRAYKGIKKKMGMIFAVILAQQLDIACGGDGKIRDGMLTILIATEGISITENLGKLGVPISNTVLSILEQFKTDNRSTQEAPSDKINTNTTKKGE